MGRKCLDNKQNQASVNMIWDGAPAAQSLQPSVTCYISVKSTSKMIQKQSNCSDNLRTSD